MGEFQLIDWIRRQVLPSEGVLLGMGDDAAVLRPDTGHDLVISTDTLNAGIHFYPDTAAEKVGHKALAVNLSDLAAMGAEPRWVLLSVSMPEEDAAWLRSFVDGFLRLAGHFGVALVGGDTCRGPLSVTVTAVGQSRQGCILTRSGANKSDLVVVSGCPGMAALARSQIESGEIPDPRAGEALHRPLPRVALGAALVGKATSCIDISDGLLADLGHIAADSGLGVRLETDRLPGHQVLDRVDVTTRRTMQLSGGDDYELCFTLPVRLESELTVLTRDLDIPLTVIGSMTGSPGVRCYDRHGVEYEESPKGFEHFS